MSTRNLDYLFRPRSVAVIGASDRAGSVGATVWRNIMAGGFGGAAAFSAWSASPCGATKPCSMWPPAGDVVCTVADGTVRMELPLQGHAAACRV